MFVMMTSAIDGVGISQMAVLIAKNINQCYSERMHRLCECGCGSSTPIAKQTRNNIGHIKGHPIRFIVGHNGRNRLVSAETRRKIGLAHSGARNNFWKGDRVGYRAKIKSSTYER